MQETKNGLAAFFDIDGTLLNIVRGQTKITPCVREAIHRLRAAGGLTFIASGRPTGYLDPELLNDDLFDGYVLMNGAHVIVHGETIYAKPLPKTTVKDVTTQCEQRGIEYILEGPTGVYLKPEYHHTAAFYDSIDIDSRTFIRAYDRDALDICKMEFYTEDPANVAYFKELLHYPGLTGVMDPFHLKNLELYSATETKGTGVLHALAALGIPVEHSYAFGDGLNDIEMMQTVGHALVMENARPQVKEVAEQIVPSVDDDGVAWGIEHVLLKELS